MENINSLNLISAKCLLIGLIFLSAFTSFFAFANACNSKEKGTEDLQEVEDLARLVISDENECELSDLPTKATVLYFKDFKKNLTSEHLKILDNLSNAIKSQSIGSVLIEGYADSRGTADQNMKISQKRMMAVSEYLKDRGVEPKKIIGKFYGKEKQSHVFFGESQESNWKKNRKVEISYFNTQKSQSVSNDINTKKDIETKNTFNFSNFIKTYKVYVPTFHIGFSKPIMTGKLGDYIKPDIGYSLELYKFTDEGPQKTRNPWRASPFLRFSNFSASGQNSVSIKSFKGNLIVFGLLLDKELISNFETQSLIGVHWFNWESSSEKKLTGIKDTSSALSLGFSFGAKIMYMFPKLSVRVGLELIEHIPGLFASYADNSFFEPSFIVGYEF